MPVQLPSLEELERISDHYRFNIQSDRLATFRGLIGHTLGSYARLDELVEPSLTVKYPRQPGFPVVMRGGRYMPPREPGYSATMRPESLEAYAFPHGPAWAAPVAAAR